MFGGRASKERDVGSEGSEVDVRRVEIGGSNIWRSTIEAWEDGLLADALGEVVLPADMRRSLTG